MARKNAYELEVDVAAGTTGTDRVAVDFSGWIEDLDIEFPNTSSNLIVSLLVNGEVVAPVKSKKGGFRRQNQSELQISIHVWVRKGDVVMLMGQNIDPSNQLLARATFTVREPRSEADYLTDMRDGKVGMPWQSWKVPDPSVSSPGSPVIVESRQDFLR
jgi:hypothetical protein